MQAKLKNKQKEIIRQNSSQQKHPLKKNSLKQFKLPKGLIIKSSPELQAQSLKKQIQRLQGHKLNDHTAGFPEFKIKYVGSNRALNELIVLITLTVQAADKIVKLTQKSKELSLHSNFYQINRLNLMNYFKSSTLVLSSKNSRHLPISKASLTAQKQKTETQVEALKQKLSNLTQQIKFMRQQKITTSMTMNFESAHSLPRTNPQSFPFRNPSLSQCSINNMDDQQTTDLKKEVSELRLQKEEYKNEFNQYRIGLRKLLQFYKNAKQLISGKDLHESKHYGFQEKSQIPKSVQIEFTLNQIRKILESKSNQNSLKSSLDSKVSKHHKEKEKSRSFSILLEETKRYKKQIEILKEEKEDLQDQIQNFSQQIGELRESITEINNEYNEIVKKYQNSRKQVKEKDHVNHNYITIISNLEENVKEKSQKLQKLIQEFEEEEANAKKMKEERDNLIKCIEQLQQRIRELQDLIKNHQERAQIRQSDLEYLEAKVKNQEYQYRKELTQQKNQFSVSEKLKSVYEENNKVLEQQNSKLKSQISILRHENQTLKKYNQYSKSENSYLRQSLEYFATQQSQKIIDLSNAIESLNEEKNYLIYQLKQKDERIKNQSLNGDQYEILQKQKAYKSMKARVHALGQENAQLKQILQQRQSKHALQTLQNNEKLSQNQYNELQYLRSLVNNFVGRRDPLAELRQQSHHNQTENIPENQEIYDQLLNQQINDQSLSNYALELQILQKQTQEMKSYLNRRQNQYCLELAQKQEDIRKLKSYIDVILIENQRLSENMVSTEHSTDPHSEYDAQDALQISQSQSDGHQWFNQYYPKIVQATSELPTPM